MPEAQQLESVAEPIWFVPREAAKRVRLSAGTLQRFRSQGRGPRYRVVGDKRIVYHVDDLDSWVRDGEEVDL